LFNSVAYILLAIKDTHALLHLGVHLLVRNGGGLTQSIAAGACFVACIVRNAGFHSEQGDSFSQINCCDDVCSDFAICVEGSALAHVERKASLSIRRLLSDVGHVDKIRHVPFQTPISSHTKSFSHAFICFKAVLFSNCHAKQVGE
jgi:hypothetical protein